MSVEKPWTALASIFNSFCFFRPMLTAKSRLADFPSLSGMVYLNTAAEGIPPLAVHEALERYWRDKTLGMQGRENHFSEHDLCRESAAAMLEMKPEEIGLCSCSSEAYNLLASALQLTEADQVVISDLDFPAGATPWIRSPRNPEVRLWKNRNGVLEIDDLQQILSPATKLVQVSLVSFLTGYRIPWESFSKAVRELAPDAVLAVDITQCFGRIELGRLNADCIISSTHKWLLGTHGGCVVAVPEEAAEKITTYAGGWYHIANAFDPDRFERVETRPGAASFGVGMPNFPAVYALRAGMDYLRGIGIGNIASHGDKLMVKLHDCLDDLGFSTMAPPQPDCPAGIVSFQHERDEEIHDDLLKENIHVMRQAGRLRIAVHGYNQTSDIDALGEVLKKWA